MRTDWNLCWSLTKPSRGSVSHRSAVCEPLLDLEKTEQDLEKMEQDLVELPFWLLSCPMKRANRPASKPQQSLIQHFSNVNVDAGYFSLLNFRQISRLLNLNSATCRKMNSGKCSSNLSKLAQYKAPTINPIAKVEKSNASKKSSH